MKLGVCFMVFDGAELLEYAARSVRPACHYVAATYQKVSYFGNPCEPGLESLMHELVRRGILDEAIPYDTDLSLHHKQNELNLRNVGLEASRRAGSTHHFSADVDEMYDPEELVRARDLAEHYDFTVVPMEIYYKVPTWRVTPRQKLTMTFIHPVDNVYTFNEDFPCKVEITRRLQRYSSYRIFEPSEIMMHHFSYVRRDIRRKFANSDNGQFYDIEEFVKTYESHQLGGRIRLLPDWMNRHTVEVENRFEIEW